MKSITIKLEGRTLLAPIIHDLKQSPDYWCSERIFEYGSSEADTGTIMAGEVRLYATTTEEMGLTNDSTWEEILAQATKLGLKKCPAEVGPQLRLQFDEQSSGTTFLIGMEPLKGEGIYQVRRYPDGFADDGKMYLSVTHISSEIIHKAPILFIDP